MGSLIRVLEVTDHFKETKIGRDQLEHVDSMCTCENYESRAE